MNQASASTMETQPDPQAGANRLIWALIGGLFVVNAFIAEALFDDDGMNAMLCALVGLLILLVPMLKLAFADLWRHRIRMNELVVLAVLAGASRGDLKTAGVIAFFMLLSIIIESRTASGAHASLEALARISPGKARRLNADGGEEMVDPQMLAPGDVLRVRPGENVLADGRIRLGDSSLQEAAITGESLPADKGAGDPVFAGTVNLTGALEVTVERAGKDTTIGRVRELILAAERTRLPFVRMVDRYVMFYTPVVLMVALLAWIMTQDLDRIVALLVVTCPIALVLATPSAMVAALAAAARVGVLIKKVNDIEAMARIDAFVFDKTGTLTTGTLSVARLAPAGGVRSEDLLHTAATAEQQSNHPVAMATVRLAQKARVKLGVVAGVREQAGRGISAIVDGAPVRIGNWAWMAENGARAEDFPDFSQEEHTGMSLLFVLRNGCAMGWLGLEDQTRTDAVNCVRQLRALGVSSISLVTGDRKGVAEKVAGVLEIGEWRGECIPADKVDAVEALKQARRHVAFVGDGVNDGPALAASHIGIAMGAAGSDVAIETATIALMNNELNRLPFLVKLSKTYRRVILQNFAFGGLFIAVGGGLSLLGMLAPVVAAAFQVGGTVAVVLNSARLVRQGEDLK